MDLSKIIRIPKTEKFKAPTPLKRQFTHREKTIKRRSGDRIMTKLRCIYLAVFFTIITIIGFLIIRVCKWIIGSESDNRSGIHSEQNIPH